MGSQAHATGPSAPETPSAGPARAHLGASQWIWVLGAAALGFGTALVFSSLLEWERRAFLVPYVVLVLVFSGLYVWYSRVDVPAHLLHQWRWGLVGAVVAGAFDVWNVLSQPSSETSSGVVLVFDLLWEGVVYGMADAVLLTIIPVMAAWAALSRPRWTETRPRRFARGLLALLAALVVIVAYHAGFAEFQGPAMRGPIVGNGVLALAYLLTRSPLAPLLGHVAMHVAGVLHGPESVVQLPPHE